MGLLPETLCGRDVDLLFRYKTPVLVSIRDRRLGIIHLVLLIAIVAYILLYEILYKGGYLLVVAPAGGYRFSLRVPTNEVGCDPITDTACFPDLAPLTATPYCSQAVALGDGCSSGQYKGSHGSCLEQRPCQLVDELDVMTPEGSDTMLATRVFQVAQSPVCATEETSCESLWRNLPGSSQDTFLADVERFTLLIDHAAGDSSGATELGDVSRNMRGWLYVPDNDATCKRLADAGRGVFTDQDESQATDSAPCYVNSALAAADNYDVFEVRDWLGAANLDLDRPAEAWNPTHSVRAQGHVLTITIEYTNIRPWSGASEDIWYTYAVSYLPNTSYKIVSGRNTLQTNDTEPVSRAVFKRYGIKIVVLQSGRLGRFDFNTLLLQLAAGSALLGLSALLTDFMALYLLPEREGYAKAKIKETRDFGDLRKEKEAKEERSSFAGANGSNLDADLSRA